MFKNTVGIVLLSGMMGCSFTTMTRPADTLGSGVEQKCTSSSAAPTTDLVATVVAGVLMPAAVSNYQNATVPITSSTFSAQDQNNAKFDTNSKNMALIVADAVIIAAYGASSIYGYATVADCNTKKAEDAKTEAIRQQVRKQAEAAEKAEKLRLQKEAMEQAERSRKEAEEQRLIVEQQSIHQDPQFPACAEMLGQDVCSVPSKFASFKSQRERQASLEEERQFQVQQEVAQDEAQKNLKNCNDFIRFRCIPIMTSTTTKECDWRDGKFSCWNNIQHNETGRYSCKETPPTGCAVPGVNDGTSPESDNERSSTSTTTWATTQSFPLKQDTSHIMCCDGTRSPKCTPTYGGPSGCCSSHGGVCDNR